MDIGELRELAQSLRADLPKVLPGEHVALARQLDNALAGNADRDALVDALTSTPATRAWLRDHAPVETEAVRGYSPLAGVPQSIAVYYVCPLGHTDRAFPAPPAAAPHCSVCGTEMITEG